MHPSLLPGQPVDAPVKGALDLDDLDADWRYIAVGDFGRASAKGAPAGFVVEYSVLVDGEGTIFVAEGDVTALGPAPPGIGVTANRPFNATCHGSRVAGLSVRSADGAVGRLVVGSSAFTE